MRRALAALAFAAGPCLAAGGHHAVDDASVQEEGVCRVEAWGTAGADTRVLHGGGACGFPLVQVAVAVERDTPSVQFKWARDATPSLAFGWEVSPSLPAGRPRDATATALGLASWRPTDALGFHANIGRDVARRGPGFARGGVAAEWWARRDLMLLAERYLETRTHFARAGVRWFLDEEWSLDVSRARRLAGPGASTWTLGLSREFKVR